MKLKIAVITQVPDPATSEGNLAAVSEIYNLPFDIANRVIVDGMTPVFDLGEIVIADAAGREIGGRERHLDRWEVGVEYFDSLERAAARSREVVGICETEAEAPVNPAVNESGALGPPAWHAGASPLVENRGCKPMPAAATIMGDALITRIDDFGKYIVDLSESSTELVRDSAGEDEKTDASE